MIIVRISTFLLILISNNERGVLSIVCGDMNEYDHVGIKNCLFNNYTPRIDDRISKGRREFHSVSGSGIRKKGVNMTVCSYLYWSIIIPIVTYGSELWVMKKDEIESLRKFQRYLGRKCQRFPSRSPNYSACAPLGWISIEKVIFVKKMMFYKNNTNNGG